MRTIRVVLALFVMCSLAEATNPACKMPAGLFRQRVSLTTQLDSAISKGDKARQNEVQTKIKGLDQQYYRFMQATSEDLEKGDVEGLSACCSQTATDPIVRLTCRWALYRSGKISAQQFVERFPVSASDRQALWMLDQIANVRQTADSVPRMFATEGPVSLYITALFTRAKGNDRAALKTYMGLYVVADGQYAELMEDQMEHLFLERPDIVLQNWDLVRANPRALQDLQESLSVEQKRQITSGAQSHCSSNAEACREMKAALADKTKSDR